ncbi:MAG: ATP-binding protein [Desulfonatronovibrionaceae bacterium]
MLRPPARTTPIHWFFPDIVLPFLSYVQGKGPDPIFVVDQFSYRILDINPRAEETYKYPKEEILGKSFLDLGPEHNREIIEHFETDTDPGGLEHYPKRLQYKKDGTPFFVNIRVSPISYEGVQAVIIASTDITDMIEKDAQLIQASKMKTLGEMSAGVAHELNQPLNAIRMGSDYLLMSMEKDPQTKDKITLDILKDISSQVDRATGIINNLRAFGRKSTLFKEKIDINRPVSGVLSVLMSQFHLDNIEFEVDLKEDLPLIYAQDNRLQQVFFNVITNARDAILERMDNYPRPKKGLIRISTSSSLEKVSVRIEDNGIGIAEDIQDNIFEPFFTTKETGQGMGLGLAISYGIIRDFNGEHKIESTVGQGTSFIIEFPRADQTGNPA